MPESADVPTDDILQTCAATHTRRAARTITRAYDQALAPCGLKVTQFTILVTLAQTDFGSITAMADRLALERSSLSRNLSRLEEQGYVRTDKEGRSRTIAITAGGRKKLAEAYPLWRAAQETVEDALGTNTWADVRALLRSLTTAGSAF